MHDPLDFICELLQTYQEVIRNYDQHRKDVSKMDLQDKK